MKKLLIVVALMLTACTTFAQASAPNTTATPIPTATGLVIPTQASVTPNPTATPKIVTPTPSPTPTRVGEYVVQSGDTIIGIAEKFGISWGYLADANKLDDPNLITVGQTLTIPEWPPKDDGREVYVVLSTQRAYAIENGKIIKEFVVSTGVSQYPTVTGHYAIYVKYRFTDMSGPGYYLPKVPYTMYFYQGYGLHGTYWHHNFGVPMSHGCVNMRTEEAEWLFGWAKVGTPVVVVN